MIGSLDEEGGILKRIIVISTGGTISSVKNKKTGLLTAGILSGKDLISMCDINFDIDVEVDSILQIPSNQMTFEYLLILKDHVERIFSRKDIDGIVITHGTDTLEETAYFLDLIISDPRPVVITGSQMGPYELGTDAFTNIKQALLVAMNKKSMNLGTLVVFNGKIFTARNVIKFHTSNVNGFCSFRFGYIGTIDLNNIYYYNIPKRSKTYKIVKDIPKIEIVKFSLGSDGSIIKFLIEEGYKGMVLEGYGRGHINPEASIFISEAVKKGLKVVVTSACSEGEIGEVYDFAGGLSDLIKRGVISGRDYQSKKARIKLAILLASNEKDIAYEFMY